MQISVPASQSGHKRNHLIRLVAITKPGFDDSTAYLSPLMAFNLGVQLELEAFITETSWQVSSRPNTDPSTQEVPKELGGVAHALPSEDCEIAPESAKGGTRQTEKRVNLSPLRVPTKKEGYGVLQQPGQSVP